ncbi:MAG: hypothetical protein AAGD25_05365 [Cyanobacteria bacterium P01_F01_bin.150]
MSKPLKSQAIPSTDCAHHSQQEYPNTMHLNSQLLDKSAITYQPPQADIKAPRSPIQSLSEQIDLSLLDNFEAVENQYKKQGVCFQNAIAIHPSNPAFPPLRDNTIILGGPKSGTIDINFTPPIYAVTGHVTSSGITVMVAFDDQGQIVGTDDTLGRNLADENSGYPPHACLSIQTLDKQPIHHIRLRCGGGQLSLSDFGFSRIKR